MRILLYAAVLSLCFLRVPGYAFEGNLKDGVYEGEYSFVKVRLTVNGGEVENIELIKHGGGGEKYAEMVGPMIKQMVDKGNTDIDAVSGATVSSINLKKAVQEALDKAGRLIAG